MYLYRRASGIYFVRLCVPSRLKAAVGKGELHRSTSCRDHRLAKIVAAELVAHWHRAIEALKHMDCWRRLRSEPYAGAAVSRLDHTESQARRRMQLVFPGSVAGRQIAQIGAGVNTLRPEQPGQSGLDWQVSQAHQHQQLG